jgi:sucrose-6-phosphate hydrolase SacC (GH32 family)
MYFSWRPHKSLAVATSTNGISWSDPRIILPPRLDTGWEDDLNRNCIVKRVDGYHMWYTGQAFNAHSWIGYATSSDGFNWRRMSDAPVLYPERPFEGASVMNPCAHWDEAQKRWRMWYSGGETYEPNVICYAESTDGIHWDKRASNPVFVCDKRYPYERDRVAGCHVFEHDGWYYMFYIGYEDIDTARICAARSPDGLTRWQRHPDNPLVSPSPGEWDADACYKPFVLWQSENRRWLLWYNGRRENAEYIGMAVHDGYDLGF